MNLDIGALLSVLRTAETNPAALVDAVALGLDAELLGEDEALVWRYMVEYDAEHGGVVPEGVLRAKFPSLVFPDERPAAASFYVDELRKRRLHNRITGALKDVAGKLKEKEPRAALEIIEAMVLESQEDARASQDVNWTETAPERIESYKRIRESQGIDGFRTPWEILDKVTRGWHPGELISLTARPGTGKSWFVVLLAAAVYQSGKVPLIVSREMGVEQFSRRIDALHAKVPHLGLRGGDLSTAQQEQFEESLRRLEGMHPYWITGDDAAVGVTGLSAKIDRLKPDVVFVDGLYLMRDDRGETGWEGITNITRDLKRLARRKSVPMIDTTQLNRGAKKLSAGLENMAYSDSIGMDSDVVIALFQDDLMRGQNKLLVKLLKQREGLTLEFKIKWDLALMEFDYSPDEDDPVDPGEPGIDQDGVLGFGGDGR